VPYTKLRYDVAGGVALITLVEQRHLFQSDDAREGIRAHLEKRPAVFTGR
jgi:enoyl-CoA hydratase/carnithine racemase